MSTFSSPLKVMHVITGLGTGGAEMMLSKLVCAGDSLRFEPVVVSLTDEGTLGQTIRSCGAPIYTIGMQRGCVSVGKLVHLARLIKKLKPDLIQGWMYHANIAALCARSLAGWHAPLLWNIRHTPYDLGTEKRLTAVLIRLGAMLSSMPASVIYNSHVSLKRHEELGFRRGNSLVIPNGFDMASFRPSPAKRAHARNMLGIPENAPVIGHVARFHPMKNHQGFLHAAAHVAGRVPEVRFVLAGKDVSRKNSLLLGWIDALGLGERVMLLDERTDLSGLLPAVDMLCLSSAWGEGFPNIIGEAMACGLPCVTTDVGDAGMIVGESGRVVRPGDPLALADACCDLLVLAPALRQTLGEAARQRIAENFSLDAIVHRYQSLYENVLGTPEKGITHE